MILSNLGIIIWSSFHAKCSSFVQLMNMTQRWSYVEEEIQVKPSPELIPDEYEYLGESSNKIAVHTFTLKQFEENVTQFCDTLKKFEIDVKEENRHSLSQDDYNNVLNKICLDAENVHIDGLILLFCGLSDVDGELKMYDGQEVKSINMERIWSKFYSSNCRGLKNKPKIFIFTVSPQTIIQSDSKKITFEMTYDTPSEADILIIFNKVDENGDFIENFCRNIEEYGKHEDIISLVTYVVSQHRPLVISTLTRKFYFAASDVRGYHSIIQDNRSDIEKYLKGVKDVLGHSMSIKEKSTKEKNKSFFGSFRLRKKKEKKEDTKEEFEESATEIQQNIILDPATSKQEVITTTTPRRSVRSRLSSQTDFDGVSNTNIRRWSEKDKKPVWRP